MATLDHRGPDPSVMYQRTRTRNTTRRKVVNISRLLMGQSLLIIVQYSLTIFISIILSIYVNYISLFKQSRTIFLYIKTSWTIVLYYFCKFEVCFQDDEDLYGTAPWMGTLRFALLTSNKSDWSSDTNIFINMDVNPDSNPDIFFHEFYHFVCIYKSACLQLEPTTGKTSDPWYFIVYKLPSGTIDRSETCVRTQKSYRNVRRGVSMRNGEKDLRDNFLLNQPMVDQTQS